MYRSDWHAWQFRREPLAAQRTARRAGAAILGNITRRHSGHHARAPDSRSKKISHPSHGIETRDLRVDTADGRLHVRTWQPPAATSKAPIVLFHDSLGSVRLWRGFPAALCARAGRTVIAYDRLGFGESDPNPHTLTVDFIAHETQAGFEPLRAQLGIARCVLFGHSVGGGMAVNVAAKYPEACVALITESAQAFLEDRTVNGIETARDLFQDPEQVARLAKYHGDKARWVLDAWVGSWLSPAFASWTLESVLPKVTCPVLAIHGIDDEYGSARHPQLIGQLSGGPVRVEVMPDTQHVPHREKEAAVLEMVADFLRDLD